MQRHKLYVTLSIATHAPRCAQHSAGESLRRKRRDSSLPHLHSICLANRAVPVSLPLAVQNDKIK